MKTEIDCTDPQQVFNRLAQLQHETQKRLDQIDLLYQKQSESDKEFDYLELILSAYLRGIESSTVLGFAYDTISDSLRKTHDYVLNIESGHATVKPIIDLFKIPGLSPEEIEKATSHNSLTRAQEIDAAAYQAAMEILEDRNPDPDVINKFLASTWDHPGENGSSCETFDDSELA